MSRNRKDLYIRRIKSFIKQFKESKIGIIGISILIFFVFVSVFANYLSDYYNSRREIILAAVFLGVNTKWHE
jgi:ABC-type antimicrobial peptide transport system permease subunit